MPQRKNPVPDTVAYDPDGFPIDLTRPASEVDIIDEETGGSRKGWETEYSVTIPGSAIEGGDPERWYLVPSIWDGEKRLVTGTDTEYGMIDEPYVSGRAAAEMKGGWIFPNYSSQEEANRAAIGRSRSIGLERGKRHLPGGIAPPPQAVTPKPVPQFGLPPGAIPPPPAPRPEEQTMSHLAPRRRRPS